MDGLQLAVVAVFSNAGRLNQTSQNQQSQNCFQSIDVCWPNFFPQIKPD